MFVGETGIARIVERTCQLMKEAGFSEDIRPLGGIDLPMLQKHINLWFSLSLDLHGNEISTNAAAYFANGLKGRAEEAKWDDHRVVDSNYTLETVSDGEVVSTDVPTRNAMNEVLRDWYVEDCQAGVNRWNKIFERYGMPRRSRSRPARFATPKARSGSRAAHPTCRRSIPPARGTRSSPRSACRRSGRVRSR